MGGAAAASVAFPASAGAGVSELEQLHALEAEIYQAWEHLGSVCGILGEAEDALWKWEKQNPKPRGREPTRAELSQYLQQTLGEQGSKASFGAAYEQDGTEHKHALAAWEARHETAKEESRYNRACKLEDLANERLSVAIEALAGTRTTTLEGLRCKARVAAKTEYANADPQLAWSMVEDLAGPAPRLPLK